ncbi:MAG: glycine/betaine ABC transporter substrate-binding protein [Chloroflexi bacterium]|nr:MAG: glycine/betaine ABC transporter substrate-binding protein [Chloroflexota bacterium]
MLKRIAISALLIAVAAVLAVACGGQPAAPQQEAAAPAAQEAPAEKITIKLAENPWSGSQVNVAVAKALLEDQLGYTVEIVTIDENAQWPALASGDLSASLEVWPSGHAENVKQYIEDQKVVENIGLLGPVGVIGWFEPKYVVDEHPELATWEGFKDPANAKLFATAETGDKGQFLAGDPSWVQYDADIIKNLGLNLEVVTAGSEEAILAALDAANSRKEPILFYFWTPHSIHAKYDLVQVELPAYSDECYAKADSGGVDCAYPSDELFKIAWGGLKDAAPDAYQFLKNFNYSTQDQISMIAAVELDGKTPEEAAKAWIADNEATWKAWLP